MPSRKRGGNPEEAGILHRPEKDGYLSETTLCVSGRHPKKADKGGEEGCSLSPRGLASQERERRHIANLRCSHQRPDFTEGWRMEAGGKEGKEKKEKKK